MRATIAVLSFVLGTAFSPGEPPEPTAEVPTLRVHRIRVVEPQAILLTIKSSVPQERTSWIPASRELVVFAGSAVQQAVAETIRKHERDALLFERLDLQDADPRLVDKIVRGAVRVQDTAASKDLLNSKFQFQLRSSANMVDVWGQASQIDFVRTTIEALSVRKSPLQQPPVGNDRIVDSPPPAAASEDPRSARAPLLAPSGPIRLVPIRGADLLLIRGQRSDIERLFKN